MLILNDILSNSHIYVTILKTDVYVNSRSQCTTIFYEVNTNM